MAPHAVTGDRIEADGRLVQHEQCRTIHQRLGEFADSRLPGVQSGLFAERPTYAALEQIHWSTNRARRGLPDWPDYRIFAFDHRLQLEEMAGYTPAKGGAFKELCLAAAQAVQAGEAPKPAAPKPTTYVKDKNDPFANVGRNDPCPCGSGKKFKKCHGMYQD